MFGLITRAEHERVLRQLADSDAANRKLFGANCELISERAALMAKLARYTTRGPGGRFAKTGERA